MSRTRSCPHRILAAGAACRVSVCDHETVHVDVGALTLRLRPDQLEAIANTLATACAELACAEDAAERPLPC